MPHAVVSSVPRTLRLLALDTSTEVLSVALGQHEGAALRHVRQHTGAGAAQSSAALIPAVLRLLSEAGWQLADLQAIVFGAGPGSFTGLRTACAVAQGLALGANVPVLPVNGWLGSPAITGHAQATATEQSAGPANAASDAPASRQLSARPWASAKERTGKTERVYFRPLLILQLIYTLWVNIFKMVKGHFLKQL